MSSTTPVIILRISPVQALELRDELVAVGLVQDQDFTWAYSQAEYDHFGPPVKPRQVKFEFVDSKLAVFYQLKWSGLTIK